MMEVNFQALDLIQTMYDEMQQMKKLLVQTTQKRWMNSKEIATYLGYSKDRMYKIKEEYFLEGIHFHKKMGKLLFDRVAIDEWVVGKDNRETRKSQQQIVDNILLSVKKV
jgi:hypothetical protein